MTSATRPNFLSRVLDIVFGKRLTPEEKRLAEVVGPPRAMRRAFDVLIGMSFLCLFILMFSKWGWLPIVGRQIGSDWFWIALLVNLLIRLGWEQIAEFYKRRAKAGEASKAALLK
jgi:hypothetical protein